MAVAFLLILWFGRGASFQDATALVAGPSESWLLTVVLQLSGLTNHRLNSLGPNAIQVIVRHRPAWTILVAVLFFPFGLLALLVTTEHIGTLVATDEGHLTWVRMRGHFTQSAIGAVNRTIPEAVGS